MNKNKIKKIAGYCRLSRDEDKENFISIEEQKRIIKDYAKSRNWNLTDDDFYIDDNVSGYTFNRPAFSKMMKKVKIGEIDVVIAKDLSRIGRHNGRVLVLIDEFKNMQKNLIAVSEMGGTYDVLNDRDDLIGITTWFNERYVKECSKKTRDHMYSKQKSGRLIMGNYYGYEKVFKDDIPMLYVIDEIRPVIELIYKLYLEDGYGFQKISEILNTKYNFPTPSEYYRMKHLEQGRIYKHKVQKSWTKDMVSNILKNEVYTGALITHKKRSINIRGKIVKLPKEEHFIFENHPIKIIRYFIQKNKEENKSMKEERKQKFIFVTGPSESGKSGAVIHMTRKFPGEVKHLKIRNIFREMYERTNKEMSYEDWYQEQTTEKFEEFWDNYIRTAKDLGESADIVVMDTLYGVDEIKFLHSRLGKNVGLLYIDAPLQDRITREYTRLRTDSPYSDRKADLTVTREQIEEQTKRKDEKKRMAGAFDLKRLAINENGKLEINDNALVHFVDVINNDGTLEEFEDKLDKFISKELRIIRREREDEGR